MIFRLACMVGIETSGQPFFRLATCRNCVSGVMVPMNIFRGVSCLMALFRQLRKRNILTSCANVWQQFSAAELWSWVLLFQSILQTYRGSQWPMYPLSNNLPKLAHNKFQNFRMYMKCKSWGKNLFWMTKANFCSLFTIFHRVPSVCVHVGSKWGTPPVFLCSSVCIDQNGSLCNYPKNFPILSHCFVMSLTVL